MGSICVLNLTIMMTAEEFHAVFTAPLLKIFYDVGLMAGVTYDEDPVGHLVESRIPLNDDEDIVLMFLATEPGTLDTMMFGLCSRSALSPIHHEVVDQIMHMVNSKYEIKKADHNTVVYPAFQRYNYLYALSADDVSMQDMSDYLSMFLRHMMHVTKYKPMYRNNKYQNVTYDFDLGALMIRTYHPN